MMIDSGIGNEFWGQAVHASAFFRNRNPTYAVVGVEETGRFEADIFWMFPFMHVPLQLMKLNSKSWQGMFFGYASNAMGINVDFVMM